MGDYAVLSWDTTYGGVGLAYALHTGSCHPAAVANELYRLFAGRITDHYAAIAVGQVLWTDGPELHAIDIASYHGDPRDPVYSQLYRPSWRQLADVIGTEAPWWHPTLRDRDAILEWRPGARPAVVVAREPELPTEDLLGLAADEPDGSPAAEVCVWLARMIHHRAARDAKDYLADFGTYYADCDGLVLGAVPALVRREGEPAELPEAVRRAGWAAITERDDSLAKRAARVSRLWNSGADWPFGAIDDVQLDRCAVAAEWAARLTPLPATRNLTVAEEYVINSGGRTGIREELLTDPATDFIAVRRWGRDGSSWIRTVAPQRIPTTAPLVSVTFSQHRVWVRTADGQLWLAPEHASRGVLWGYRGGGGPSTLAVLLDRLLDDITSPAVDRLSEAPPGLKQLTENAPQDTPSTFTRDQLESARDAS